MYVDVQTVVGLELQRCLHTGIGEYGCRRVALVSLTVLGYHLTYARKRSDVVLILLRVVVARNPIGSMIACHSKLCVLLLYHEIVERLLLREFIAKSHTVVVNTESDGDVAL